MKTNLKSGVFSPTTRMQALQWATVAVALQHSKYFELDGVIRVGDDIRNLDPVRWKYDHSKRLGQIMDKDMPCIRSVEDMVFLRMLSIQVKCYADLLDGITEDPAHIQECRSLMEEYIGNHGSRIQSSPAMLINKGLLFLTRSWGQISRVATLLSEAPGQRLTSEELLSRIRETNGSRRMDLAIAGSHAARPFAMRHTC